MRMTMNSDFQFDDPLPTPMIEAARTLYAAPGHSAYWTDLETKIMARIAEAAPVRWWQVLNGWARGGLVAAAAALLIALAGMLLLHAHAQDNRTAFDAVMHQAPDSLTLPSGVLTETDGPEARGATFRDIISR
jgi:hypothetical protein